MKRGPSQPPTNMAASVKARLLKLAQSGGEDFNALLTRYVLERFLYRLASSDHANEFVLKGAMLFTVWSNRPHRATKDIDLLGYGSPDSARLAAIVGDICQTAVESDGVFFDDQTIDAAAIREEAVYDGIRIKLLAHVGSARISVQIDVGFGDSTEPAPVLLEVPTLLDQPRPKLHGYRREVAIAEKLHAMVDLGMNNSRMKDYFDIWFLSQHFRIQGPDLTLAIRSTFSRRMTTVPKILPTGLTGDFAESSAKLAQWGAFTRRTRLAVEAPSLAGAILSIAALVLPLFEASDTEDTNPIVWNPGGPWTMLKAREPVTWRTP